MVPPADLDRLSPAELKSLIIRLFEHIAELERTITTLRDEIARLNGGPGRPNIKPNIKPSGMEKATEPTSLSVSSVPSVGPQSQS